MDWFLPFFSWYIYLVLISIIFFPLAKRIFPKAIDGGYAFSRAIGILFLTYATMFLGVLRLVPFGRSEILILLALVAFVSYRKTFQKGIDVVGVMNQHKQLIRWILIEELIFFFSVLLWTIVRGQEPSIHGLEKFMDYGFMQSIGRSKFFPPLDMWYSAEADVRPNGFFINYYYFGHLSGALLIKLSGVLSEIGYNLILATILGLSMSMTFGILINVIQMAQTIIFGARQAISRVRLALFGFLGACVLNFAGNWHTLYIFTRGYENEKPIPPWQVLPIFKDLLPVLGRNFPNILGGLGEYSRYWYPNATRFIPKTIHEFPSYSYVVADLHGHVFDIPFVLLTFAVLFLIVMPLILKKWGVQIDETHNSGTQTKKKNHEIQSHHEIRGSETAIRQMFGEGLFTSFLLKCVKTHVPLSFCIGFLTAVHYMTNAFDGPIYLLLSIVILFLLHRFSSAFILNIVVLGFGFFYFALPFSTFFEPFVSGIGVNCAYPLVSSLAKAGGDILKFGPFLFEKGNCQRSELYQVLMLWGFFWSFGLILMGYIVAGKRYLKQLLTSQSALRETEAMTVRKSLAIDLFVGIIFAFGTFLIIIPEFFYIKDIYPTHFRANTMFKLGYQAYMMMSIASIYVLWRTSTISYVRKGIRKMITGFSWASMALVLVYMNFAIQSYYGKMDRPVKLDGIVWLKDQYRDTYEIVEFFNNKVTGQPVILEAQGDSYTDFDAVSSYTGLPTVAGWWVHQWLWRGSADVVGRRIPDIESIYQSDNIDDTRRLLRKYMVEYVVISSQEHKKYDVNNKKVNEDKFKKLGEEVFRSSDGKGAIYRIR